MTIPESAAPLADTKDLPHISRGVSNLLAHAIQASKSLHDTIQSFRNFERTIRDLRSELKSLIQVLQSFEDPITHTGPIVSMMALPLQCCYKTCEEFKAVVIKCTENTSSGSRTSFRDWAQIRYMGGDIRDLKDTLSCYKSTIAVVRGSLDIGIVEMTREEWEQYEEMIRETTGDLEAYFRSINDKLVAIAIANHPRSEPDPTTESNVKWMEEEKQSAEKCILICGSVSSKIRRHRDKIQRPDAAPDQDCRQRAVALGEAKDRMVRTITDLQKWLSNLSDKSLGTEAPRWAKNIEQDQHRLLKKVKLAKQCIEAEQAKKYFEAEIESAKQCLEAETELAKQCIEAEITRLRQYFLEDDY